MRLAALLPWRDFPIDTSWSPEVADAELRRSIRGLSGDAGALFFGRAVGAGEYEIQRVITYRNSFLPIIRARIEPSHHEGARVRVRMRVHPVVIGIMVFWLGGTALGAVVGIAAAMNGEPGALLAAVFPFFGLAMVSAGFGFEARRAERLLREVFAAAPALPPPPDTGEAYR